jgi:integrase
MHMGVAMYKRGDIWCAKISYKVLDAATGKLKAAKPDQWNSGVSDKTKATKAAHKRHSDLMNRALGEAVYSENYESARDAYLTYAYAMGRLRGKTSGVDRYAVSFKQLNRIFAGVDVVAIKHAKLQEFVLLRAKDGVTPSSIRRDLSALSAMMSWLVENDKIEINCVPAFMKKQKKHGLVESESRESIFSHSETVYIIDFFKAKSRKAEQERFKLAANMAAWAIEFTLETGLRLEECCGITWGDISLVHDFERVTVRKEVAKSKRQRRIPMSKRAVAILKMIPRNGSCKFVFWRIYKGEPTRRINFNKVWLSALRDLGMRGDESREDGDGRWHDLRRTCACRWLAAGMSMAAVSRLLGHANIAQTEKAYAFLRDEDLRKAIEGVEVEVLDEKDIED